MIKANDITGYQSLREATIYFRQCLVDLDNGVDDLKVAGWMTNIIANESFDKWYATDPQFAEIFDCVASLEVPDGPKDYRKAKWQKVRTALHKLEQKYGQ